MIKKDNKVTKFIRTLLGKLRASKLFGAKHPLFSVSLGGESAKDKFEEDNLGERPWRYFSTFQTEFGIMPGISLF